MDNKQREEINLIADTVREQLGLSIPVNVREAVEKLGGRICYNSNLENYMEGMIRRGDNEEFVITVSENSDNPLRERFTVAHEIGHLFLHMGFLLNPNKWENESTYNDSVFYRYGYSTEEYEANEFAAALLMPRDEFIKVATKNLTGNSYLIKPIADHFEVSETAAINRGRFLGIFSWER